jgi:nucleoside-diphosphate-sugar epimerase
MKKAMVLGGGGFIGAHLVKRLKKEGYWVRAVDLKYPEYCNTHADEFVIGDLRSQTLCDGIFDGYFDEIYQLAADMGGAGYIFTGENDADVMHNSALININVLERSVSNCGKLFYSSSACIYPERNQLDPNNPNCSEDSAYPAAPDSEYGWEKLFSERLYATFMRNKGVQVRVARFHNIFGPEGSWNNGKEKSPAAICRKVAEAENNTQIEIWGDGLQTRSFMYIDECIEAVRRFMDCDFVGPVNIGSEEMISINDLAKMAIQISGKTLTIKNVKGPIGVRGRRSDNRLFKEKVGWESTKTLKEGIEKTYSWIDTQVRLGKS